jgi:hypothetical protein
MASVEESELFRSLAIQHPGVEVWLDDLADTDECPYFWVVSHPAARIASARLSDRIGWLPKS